MNGEDPDRPANAPETEGPVLTEGWDAVTQVAQEQTAVVGPDAPTQVNRAVGDDTGESPYRKIVGEPADTIHEASLVRPAGKDPRDVGVAIDSLSDQSPKAQPE